MQQASIEEVEYPQERNLDKNLVLRLASIIFITRHENVLISDAIGGGKSFLATADGFYAKELARLERLSLLIQDDWGLPPRDLPARMAILQILEEFQS